MIVRVASRVRFLTAVVFTALALAGCAVLGARSAGRPMRLEAALAGALALSLVASPHLLAHDLVLLAPAFGWCLARAAAADGTAAWPSQAAGRLLTAWVGLNLLVDLDTGNSAPAPPGRLVPWALLLAGAAALVACGLRLPRARLAVRCSSVLTTLSRCWESMTRATAPIPTRPTRLSTSSPKNIRCVGPPARLTERRNKGSTHSSTSGR